MVPPDEDQVPEARDHVVQTAATKARAQAEAEHAARIARARVDPGFGTWRTLIPLGGGALVLGWATRPPSVGSLAGLLFAALVLAYGALAWIVHARGRVHAAQLPTIVLLSALLAGLQLGGVGVLKWWIGPDGPVDPVGGPVFVLVMAFHFMLVPVGVACFLWRGLALEAGDDPS